MTEAARTDAEARSVVLECHLDESPETVWRALTVPEIVAEWLGPNTLRPEPGASFTIDLDPGSGGAIACEVLEVVPLERLSYSWRSCGDGPAVDTVVTFELERTEEAGTNLRIVHEATPVERRVPAVATADVVAFPRRPVRARAYAATPRSARSTAGMILRRAA
ncbi:SRPBCC family protein [Microvirga thermotolerans]|uniref:ATPase n=1 Tax=Microvirga thermotolerans TaxID=2651334 RepID=A0A5P9JUH6_9HYPH|nr:SRPBCC domain-containing protein [Microvirga thermotolerans]QFU15771.1 ATPase [Microvirga thermotolerans]